MAWLCPLPPGSPRNFRIVGFFDFSENVDLGALRVGFEVWEGLPWMGNVCGLHLDGFSAHFDQYESILENFSEFRNFYNVMLLRSLSVMFFVLSKGPSDWGLQPSSLLSIC